MNPKKIYSYYHKVLSKLDNLLESFEKNQRIILDILRNKDEYDDSNVFNTYFAMIQRHDKSYNKYLHNAKIKKKANIYLLKILKTYYAYISEYNVYKEFIGNFSITGYQTNTIKQILTQTNKINEKILELLTLDFNFEYNDYLENTKILEKHIINLKANLSIIEHITYTNFIFNYDVNYNKLEKLSLKDLKPGDIIFFDENPKTTCSFVTRQVSRETKSRISHLVLFFKNDMHEYMIFQARGANRKKTYIAPIHIRKDYKYIVLRLKNGLSKEEEKRLLEQVLEHINIKFSLIKIYTLWINRILIRFYKDWFPFIDMGKNPLKSKRVFCSEVIATVYRNIGRNISNKPDPALVAPIDLFNSPELEIVGYIQKD